MGKDRMNSLHRILASMRTKSWIKQTTRLAEIEETDSGDNNFLSEIEDIRALLLKMDQDVEKLKRKQSDTLVIPLVSESDQKELEVLSASLKSGVGLIRSKIKSGGGAGAPNLTTVQQRIIQTQNSTLLQHFVESLNTYNQAQVDYQDRCKAKMKRQLEITGKKIPDEEIERALDDRKSFRVFAQNIFFDTKEAQKTLSDLEVRHEDILRLEKSIVELHDMFVEMRDLVEIQGETVLRIEENVSDTVVIVEVAGTELKSAKQSYDKYRKKKLYLFVGGIFILVVLIIIITVVCL